LARDGKSVDTVLARELRDVMSAQSEWLAREIPGIRGGSRVAVLEKTIRG
jgi:hypothetical protein